MQNSNSNSIDQIVTSIKITGINDGELGFIPVVDFFKQEPWELPGDPFFSYFEPRIFLGFNSFPNM
jgi:hypothetical protein